MRKNVIKVALLALLVSAAGCSNDNQVADPTNEGDLKPIPAAYSKVQHTPLCPAEQRLGQQVVGGAVGSDRPSGQERVCGPREHAVHAVHVCQWIHGPLAARGGQRYGL